MVKPPTFDSNGMKRGAWSKEEDERLRAYILEYGHNNWRLLPILAGLPRCGKSCRLRWVNYLKPGLKREKFTKQEEELVIKMHNKLGNKWSAIAAKFPGRTDNEIKNYYHAHIKKRGGKEKIIRNLEASPSPSSLNSYSSSSSSSSSSLSCVTADDHQQESSTISPIADLYSFAQARDLQYDDFLMTATELTQQECFDLPPFPAEDFRDFDFSLGELENDSCSDFPEKFWAESFEEDFLDLEIW